MNRLTYGSLMYPQVWSRIVDGAHPHRKARVAGFSRRQLPGAVHPAMIPADPNSTVDGILYANLTRDDIARLDRFEDEGIDYKRIAVEAVTDVGLLEAFTYIYMHPDRVSPLSWDPVVFAESGLRTFLDTYVRDRE